MHEVEDTAKKLQSERKDADALSFEDIELMLGNRTDLIQMTNRVNEYGVAFELTAERRARLKGEGANDSMLDAMARAKRK
jgi:hypothetical protein